MWLELKYLTFISNYCSYLFLEKLEVHGFHFGYSVPWFESTYSSLTRVQILEFDLSLTQNWIYPCTKPKNKVSKVWIFDCDNFPSAKFACKPIRQCASLWQVMTRQQCTMKYIKVIRADFVCCASRFGPSWCVFSFRALLLNSLN